MIDIGYIYKIENLVNGKKYIGKTVFSVEKRWREHINSLYQKHSFNYPIYRAIRKYGIRNFKIETLEEVDNSLLNNREKYWISYFDTFKHGYNATQGGEGVQKYNHEEIVKYYLEVKDIPKVCKKFGCNRGTVFSILGEHNISARPDHEELAKKYLEIKNLKEVAKLYGCSTPTVRNACIERNIPIEKSTAKRV